MSFVVIEGPNGSGKTSIKKRFAEEGYDTLSSPSSTPLSQMLRPACRGVGEWADLDPVINFLLFSAARYDEYLRIVHENPNIVVADRWWLSTYVYQCMLEHIPVDFLEYTFHPEEKIDLVVLLTADTETLIQRVQDERKKNEKHGHCRWVIQSDTISQIADVYRNQLVDYLRGRNILVEIIDTTEYDEDEVFEKVKLAIDTNVAVGV